MGQSDDPWLTGRLSQDGKEGRVGKGKSGARERRTHTLVAGGRMVSKPHNALSRLGLRFDTILPRWQKDVAECPLLTDCPPPHTPAISRPRVGLGTTQAPGERGPTPRRARRAAAAARGPGGRPPRRAPAAAPGPTVSPPSPAPSSSPAPRPAATPRPPSPAAGRSRGPARRGAPPR